MKRMIKIPVGLVLLFLLVGCGMTWGKETEVAQTTQIGNPWSAWSSLAEAEQTVGFSFGLPEVIADTYVAEEIRTMNNQLMEVVYTNGELEVRVRKQKGEGQDISGDYNEYDICREETMDGGTIICYGNSSSSAEKQLVSYEGFSWSFVAVHGYGDASCSDFINFLL